MFLPGQSCMPQPSPFVKGCCTPGHTCATDNSSATGRSCKPVAKNDLQYTFDQQAKGGCSTYVDVGGQCGGAGFDCYTYNTCDQFGPWSKWCCPNGYSCQPKGQDFRLWTCQVNVQDAAPGESWLQQLLQTLIDQGWYEQHHLHAAVTPSSVMTPHSCVQYSSR